MWQPAWCRATASARDDDAARDPSRLACCWLRETSARPPLPATTARRDQPPRPRRAARPAAARPSPHGRTPPAFGESPPAHALRPATGSADHRRSGGKHDLESLPQPRNPCQQHESWLSASSPPEGRRPQTAAAPDLRRPLVACAANSSAVKDAAHETHSWPDESILPPDAGPFLTLGQNHDRSIQIH